MRALRPTLVAATAWLAVAGPCVPTGSATETDAGAEKRTDWQVFASAEGRFRVELPETPRVERSQRSTMLGAVEETRYVLRFGEDETVALAVEVHDIPRLAARIVPAATILEQTRRGVLRDMEAEQIEASEVTIQGFPARDFTYRIPTSEADLSLAPDAPSLYERAIAVLVESRIYLLTALAPGSPDAHPGIARFFASFRFWREGTEPPEPVIELRD